MTDFSLTIKNPYSRSKKFPVALLHFTAGFLLLNGWYEAKVGHYPEWLSIAYLIFGIFEIVYAFFAIRLQRKIPHLGSAIRLLAGIAFAVYAWMLFRDKDSIFGVFMVIIAIAFFVIYRVEERWNIPFVVRVNKEGVWFPRTFKSQLYTWNSFNHVILRDNLLTLDFASNRVIQMDIYDNYNESEAGDFNTFCNEQLGSSTHQQDQIKNT